MSHGPTSEGSSAEPNLTPLLDVVLQLLMFFMMCVNFVTEQVNQDIKLPKAQSARPMDKQVTDVLFLNLNDRGQLLIPGEPRPLHVQTESGAITYFLNRQKTEALQSAKIRGDSSGQVKTVVVIRAHLDVNYMDVFQLLNTCKSVGYTRLQLRAMIQSKNEG